jgi:hypothetical protein
MVPSTSLFGVERCRQAKAERLRRRRSFGQPAALPFSQHLNFECFCRRAGLERGEQGGGEFRLPEQVAPLAGLSAARRFLLPPCRRG